METRTEMQEPTANEQLTAWLDGELSATEVAELEHRLARDPALRAELDGLQRAVDTLRTRGPVQAPPSLFDDVMRRIEDEPSPNSFWDWLRRPFGVPWTGLAVAGAAVAVVVVSVGGTAVTLMDSGESQVGRALDPYTAKVEPERSSDDAKRPEVKTPEAQDKPPARVASPTVASSASKPKDAPPAPPVESKADRKPDPQGTSVTSGTADPPDVYPVARHRVSVSPADLETIARLYAKYGSRGAGSKEIADLGKGDHAVTLELRDAAARNAFLQELQRQFGAAYVENTPSKDTLTLDANRVDLQVYVNELVPESGKANATPSISPIK